MQSFRSTRAGRARRQVKQFKRPRVAGNQHSGTYLPGETAALEGALQLRVEVQVAGDGVLVDHPGEETRERRDAFRSSVRANAGRTGE